MSNSSISPLISFKNNYVRQNVGQEKVVLDISAGFVYTVFILNLENCS